VSVCYTNRSFEKDTYFNLVHLSMEAIILETKQSTYSLLILIYNVVHLLFLGHFWRDINYSWRTGWVFISSRL